VRCGDLRLAGDRWPVLAAAAAGSGLVSVYSVPLRCRRTTIGALSVFGHEPGGDPDEVRVTQALADVTAAAIVNDRATGELRARVEQLQAALASRVVLEQAKGVLAERHGIGMAQAFAAMREYARSRNLKLSVVARAVIDGGAALDGPLPAGPRPAHGAGENR